MATALIGSLTWEHPHATGEGRKDKKKKKKKRRQRREEDVDQLNRPVTKSEIEYVIKTLPTNKCPGQDGYSQVNSTNHTMSNLFSEIGCISECQQ